MALIRCQECRKKVSEKAETCPKCGAPVGPSVEAHKREQRSQTAAGCLIIGGMIGFAIYAMNTEIDSPRRRAPQGPSPSPRTSPAPTARLSPTPNPSASHLLDDLGSVTQGISKTTSTPIRWKQSQLVPGEWVMSPLGASVNVAAQVNGLEPNLSFFAYGTSSDRADRIVVKLNMNESQELERMQVALIEAVNSLLSRDGITLSDEMTTSIRNAASITSPAVAEHSKQLLHRDSFEHFDVELFEEKSTYTALAIHILRPGTTVGT